jgi:hypothetical protein
VLHELLSVEHEFEFESVFSLVQKFTPGSNQRETTMGVYVRDLILGQVCSLNFCFADRNKHCFSDQLSCPSMSSWLSADASTH